MQSVWVIYILSLVKNLAQLKLLISISHLKSMIQKPLLHHKEKRNNKINPKNLLKTS